MTYQFLISWYIRQSLCTPRCPRAPKDSVRFMRSVRPPRPACHTRRRVTTAHVTRLHEQLNQQKTANLPSDNSRRVEDVFIRTSIFLRFLHAIAGIKPKRPRAIEKLPCIADHMLLLLTKMAPVATVSPGRRLCVATGASFHSLDSCDDNILS